MLLSTLVSAWPTRRAEVYPRAMWPTVLYTEGIKALAVENNPGRALDLFKKAVALDSLHAPSFYSMAGLLMEEDTEKALGYSHRARMIDTTNSWYGGQYARLLAVAGQYDKALDEYARLARISPRDPENYRMLAALYEARKQPYTAIAILDSAEYKLGRIEELAQMKLNLLLGVNLYDKAIAESRALVDEYPWNPDNHRMLAELYSRAGKDSLATLQWTAALEIDSTDVRTLMALSDYYRSRNDVQNFFATGRRLMLSDRLPLTDKLDFIRELKGIRAIYTENFYQIRSLVSLLLVKYPADFDVLDMWGETLIASEGVEPALEFYKSHLGDKGVPESFFNTVLDMEGYLKRPDSLARYTALALERFPRNVDLYLRQGATLSYMDHDAEALESYREAMRYAASDSLRSVVYGMIGDQYHKISKAAKGNDSYRKALRLWPDNSAVLNNFAYFLTTDGPDGRDLDKAVEMSKRAIELSTGNATYLDTYAWALFKAGRPAEAKKVMQQAVSLDSSDSDVLLVHYGDILYALGEYFMATVYWEKARDKGYDKDEIEQRLKLTEGK